MATFVSLGIDLASQPANTALCRLQWTARGARVQQFGSKFGDEALLVEAQTATCVGIDAPFGWPLAFKEALVGAADFRWPHGPGWSDALRDSLRFRRTDLYLRSLPERFQPLSVSSELLGVTAMRCAGLLRALGVEDRSGQSGHVFEVYPSASLRRWGIETKGYKQPQNVHLREQLLATLLTQASWLEMTEAQRQAVVASDHQIDALIASLTTGMAWINRNLIEAIPEKELEHAQVEGWILLPRPDSLRQLAFPSRP